MQLLDYTEQGCIICETKSNRGIDHPVFLPDELSLNASGNLEKKYTKGIRRILIHLSFFWEKKQATFTPGICFSWPRQKNDYNMPCLL